MAPPLRTLSSSSVPAIKRGAHPFKPPGPAKKAKATESTSGASSNATRRTTSAPAKIKPGTNAKGKKPAAQIIDSDSSTDDQTTEDEFGEDITIDDNIERAISFTGNPGTSKNKDNNDDAMSITSSNLDIVLEAEPVLKARSGIDDSSDDEAIPGIPHPLLTRLVHESFTPASQAGPMKIGKDANSLLATYIDVFVKEAVMRSALRKKEDLEMDTGENGDDIGGLDDEWLDVGDLEAIAPGLVLDF